MRSTLNKSRARTDVLLILINYRGIKIKRVSTLLKEKHLFLLSWLKCFKNEERCSLKYSQNRETFLKLMHFNKLLQDTHIEV